MFGRDPRRSIQNFQKNVLFQMDNIILLCYGGEIRELTIDDTHSVRMARFYFWIVFYVIKAYFKSFRGLK
jgi:hypothetical protein